MKQEKSPLSGSRSLPVKIVLVYAVFTCLWIFSSIALLGVFVKDNQLIIQLCILNGVGYVVICSIILYFLFRTAIQNIKSSQQRYQCLFQEAAISILEMDFSGVKELFNQLNSEGVTDWADYFDKNPEAMVCCASSVRITDINNEGLRFWGISQKKDVPVNLESFFTAESLVVLKKQMVALANGAHRCIGEIPVRSLKGDLFYLFFQFSVVPGYEHNLSKVLISIIDITKRKKTEEAMRGNEQRLRQIIDLVPQFIFAKDIEGHFILVNRSVAQAYGTTVEGLVGKTDADFNGSKEEVDHFRQDDLEVIKSGKEKFIPEEIITNAQGQTRVLSTTKIPFYPFGMEKPCVLGVAQDITERKNLENNLVTLAHYDPLTNLPNRTLFFEKTSVGLSRARRSAMSCAVLFVDLDHFKDVNDTLGHTLGDQLLKDTTAKLIDCVREMDTIARLGGDEFIIFLNGIENENSARQIAERIKEKFNGPRQVWGNDLFVTSSIGIAIFPNDGNNLEDLLKNADTAMYAAKSAGRNTYCFFNQQMNEKAVAKVQIERGLRDALIKSQFKLYYQPIMGVRDGNIRGFEVLLRWVRNDGSVVSPSEFIPIAEETGLIVTIGEWVLNEACRFSKKIEEMGFEGLVISVNVSVAQLRRKAIVETIKNALLNNKLLPESLEIEVTESILIDSIDSAINILKQIRKMGVKISLDDFGTGYSSLRHLQRLPISNIKIDHLFIKELTKGGVESAMTSTIISLAHTLKLGVVAEGVEHDVQLRRLMRENCDYSQGYLFSKPMPEKMAISFLEKNSRVFKATFSRKQVLTLDTPHELA